MGIAVAVFAALGLALAWFLFSGRDSAPEPTARRRVNEEIDYTELEQAERDVRAADDADGVRDWGPGATPPPVA
jgi:hypothetical protein